jgi:hypothetical protein
MPTGVAIQTTTVLSRLEAGKQLKNCGLTGLVRHYSGQVKRAVGDRKIGKVAPFPLNRAIKIGL